MTNPNEPVTAQDYTGQGHGSPKGYPNFILPPEVRELLSHRSIDAETGRIVWKFDELEIKYRANQE